jgi:hypothetical protein
MASIGAMRRCQLLVSAAAEAGGQAACEHMQRNAGQYDAQEMHTCSCVGEDHSQYGSEASTPLGSHGYRPDQVSAQHATHPQPFKASPSFSCRLCHDQHRQLPWSMCPFERQASVSCLCILRHRRCLTCRWTTTTMRTCCWTGGRRGRGWCAAAGGCRASCPSGGTACCRGSAGWACIQQPRLLYTACNRVMLRRAVAQQRFAMQLCSRLATRFGLMP